MEHINIGKQSCPNRPRKVTFIIYKMTNHTLFGIIKTTPKVRILIISPTNSAYPEISKLSRQQFKEYVTGSLSHCRSLDFLNVGLYLAHSCDARQSITCKDFCEMSFFSWLICSLRKPDTAFISSKLRSQFDVRQNPSSNQELVPENFSMTTCPNHE